MSKILRTNIYVLIILLVIIFLGIFFRLLPYIYNKYDFLIGFDTGKYVSELQEKVSTSPKRLDLWVEPGLNTFFSNINVFIGGDSKIFYKYILPIFVSIIFPLIIYEFTKTITNSSVAGVVSSLYIASSIILLQGTFDSFYRQIISSIIYMVFLFFLDKFLYHDHEKKATSYLHLAILGAGIIFYHRAVTLLYFLTYIILFIKAKLYKKENKVLLQKILTIFIASLILSSPYWIFIISENLNIIRDTIIFSIQGKSAGETVLKNLSRTDNQLKEYFLTIPLIFISSISLVKVLLTDKPKTNIGIITLFLIPYIYFKAVFANRFVLNLDILFSILLGIGFIQISKKYNKVIGIFFIFSLLIINIIAAFKTSISKQPYIPTYTKSISWIEKNINKNDSVLIAPDALSTILTSLGYHTAIYEFKLKTGEKDNRILKTEKLLLRGQNNISLWNNSFSNFKNLYVIFGDWDIKHPFTRSEESINLNSWDKSSIAKLLYSGDYFIRRIYRIKIAR